MKVRQKICVTSLPIQELFLEAMNVLRGNVQIISRDRIPDELFNILIRASHRQ
jgi:hypothetical protein